MQTITSLLAIAALTGTASADLINFDDAKPGAPPPGWTATKTGSGSPKWSIETDASAPSKPNVLKQSGEAAYPLCILDGAKVKDGFIEVKFKPISGDEDQAAGLIWRVKDADNYYVCRANALEGNVVLYKTENGKRSSLDIVGRKGGYGVKAPVPKNEWSTLRVQFEGSKFAVQLNGKQLFEVEDATFSSAGKVGLWTKADSVTLFDDFSYGAK